MSDVGIYRGSFLDVGGRRLIVISRPGNDLRPLAQSQTGGHAQIANARIRAGGWIALSTDLAAELNASRPGDNVARVLGPRNALAVRTADEMVDQRDQVVSQGLSRLRQISMMVLIAAAIAIIAAMFTAVWQRRANLRSLRALGFQDVDIHRALVFESGLLVVFGGVTGILFGLFCQLFANRWIEIASGLQVPFQPATESGLVALVEIILLTTITTVGLAVVASKVSRERGPVEWS